MSSSSAIAANLCCPGYSGNDLHHPGFDFGFETAVLLLISIVIFVETAIVAIWLAAHLFIGFLVMSNIIDFDGGGKELIVGLVFCAAGILLSRVQYRNVFVPQLGLAYGLAGQVLFAAGPFNWMYSQDIPYDQHTFWIIYS